MWRVLAVAFVVASVLVALLAFSGSVSVGADDLPCVGIDWKTGDRCGEPPYVEPPDPCQPSPEGCDGDGGFMPLPRSCAECGVLPGCGGLSIWWGGMFGSWLLVLGVMGWIGRPLWRHRKRRRLSSDEGDLVLRRDPRYPHLPPFDPQLQRLIIMAKERAGRFR